MSKFASTMACIDSLVAVLSASTDLKSVVESISGGRDLLFWIGYDELKLPPVASAPYLVLMPNQYGRNDDRTQNTHGILCAVVVPAGEPDASGSITRYRALEDAELIARGIDAALETWISDNFGEGSTKTPFVNTMPLPAAKAVWSYEFHDQM